MKKKLLTAFAIMISQLLSAQPVIQWQKCFGGTQEDGANELLLTADKGYVFAGYASSSNGDVTGFHGGSGNDNWIGKVDSTNTLLWKKCFGGTSGETIYSLFPTLDGGYCIAGTTLSSDGDFPDNNGSNDAYVMKLDSAGGVQWKKCFGGSLDDNAYSGMQTSDGKFIIVGATGSNDSDVTGNHGLWDARIMKLDVNGDLLWQHCYGGTGYDAFLGVTTDDLGNLICSGYTKTQNNGDVSGNHGNYDVWMVKTDSMGGLLSQKCFGGSGDDFVFDMSKGLAGDLLVCGIAEFPNGGDVSGNHGGNDAWVLKMDTGFTVTWKKCFGGTANEEFTTVKEWTGGIILCGSTFSNDGDFSTLNHGQDDLFTMEINQSGTLQWAKCMGGTLGDFGYGLDVNSSGDIFVCGSVFSNNGDVTSNHGNADAWVAKLSAPTGMTEPSAISSCRIFPNPASERFNIELTTKKPSKAKLEVRNILGENVMLEDVVLRNGENKFSISADHIGKPGIYFVLINAGDGIAMQKLIIQE